MRSSDSLDDAVREAAASGAWVRRWSRNDALNDLARGADWEPERTISAELLVNILVGRPDGPPPRALRLEGVRISGQLNLEAAELTCPLVFKGCWFDERLVLREVTAPSVRLPWSHVPSIDARQLRTRGDLDLSDGFVARGCVSLLGADIGGLVNCTDATFDNPGGTALQADEVQVGRSMFCRGTFRARGQVRLPGAHISGQLDCTGATFDNPGRIALLADGVKVGGSMFCRDTFDARGQVRLLGAHIGGQLDCTHATFDNARNPQLNGESIPREGNRALPPGDIRSRDADATVDSDDGVAVNADGIEVDQDVFFSEGFVAYGEVRLRGANIGGQLNCSAGSFDNPGGIALYADVLSVGRGMFARQAFSACGEVRLLGAHIGGELDCSGATLDNASGTAFNAHGISVDQNVLCRRPFMADGTVRLTGARVSGRLDFAGARIREPDTCALSLAEIQTTSVVLTGASISGGAELDWASVGTLVVDAEEESDALPGPLSARGWRVGDVEGAIRDDRRAAARWLDTVAAMRLGYAAQPWHELAAVYDRNGHPADARWMRWQAARRTTRVASHWSKPGRWLYGSLAGHGYYPLLAVAWLVAAFLVTWAVAGVQRTAFTPTDLDVATAAVASPGDETGIRITAATACDQLTPDYPCFSPGLYALDTVLPAAATGQAAAWRLNTTDPWLPWLLTAVRAFGWILTALVLAGVTGLLRKT